MRKNSITVSEWVTRAITESRKSSVNDHFDIFKDYENPSGLSLLKYACELLYKAHFITLIAANKGKSFNAFVSIPLGDSRKIKFWDGSNWVKIGKNNKETTYEPPSLCLLEKGEDLFGNLDIEEYRCPIKLPADFLMGKSRKISELFCCHRNQLYFDDFCSQIYLYIEGSFN